MLSPEIIDLIALLEYNEFNRMPNIIPCEWELIFRKKTFRFIILANNDAYTYIGDTDTINSRSETIYTNSLEEALIFIKKCNGFKELPAKLKK